MEISLIRHGKSKQIDNNRMTYKEFKNWIKKYDDSGVFEENSYPSETLEKIASANLVITSDLKRSIESAKLLNPDIHAISEPLFRETELPNLLTKLWGLKSNPNIWAVILRCLWFSGYSRGCESLSNAKARAKIASDLLVGYAQEHTSVVLVGHGFFNMLIAKELQKMGWKCERKINSKHWNCTTYSLFS
ncbi:histidine phosphatase family protein [Halalkalibacter alkalisediminis]|uniref:Histidine phosphatase family protein n=1 Tax=Halalkalibacter alkalisediminis TaxID=935616 RepID=A0ABV6NN47_9BACI|nr:histidine phosphatase family protein [Halalkalibacter alkalisediminis]